MAATIAAGRANGRMGPASWLTWHGADAILANATGPRVRYVVRRRHPRSVRAALPRCCVTHPIDVGGRLVGHGHPVFVIAEAGVNHDGDIEKALALVDAAAEAGADAVKFQTFRADQLACADAPKAAYQAAQTGSDESQQVMLQRLELSRADHISLLARARRRNIIFLSTPFDGDSARMLVELGVPALKIGSGELTDSPLLSTVAQLGVPLIISTGMSALDEVTRAVIAVRPSSAFALLHCVSCYPAEPHECNLAAMATLRAAFQAPVGFSDHTMGSAIAIAAVALGASILEKHVTLNHRAQGPDHSFSLEPRELAELVKAVREVESARGDGVKRPGLRELETAAVARKSLTASCALSAGASLLATDLVAKRPGTGVPPYRLPQLVGRTLARDVCAGARISEDDFA